jgi:hypothetical protein
VLIELRPKLMGAICYCWMGYAYQTPTLARWRCVVEDMSARILKEDARTLVGLDTKARALTALAIIEEREHPGRKLHTVGLIHGTNLAFNIRCVIGIGDADSAQPGWRPPSA